MTPDIDEQRLVAAFHREVDDLHPDLTGLALRAARDGAGLRRRRRVRTGLAVAACLAVVGAAGGALAGTVRERPGDSGEPSGDTLSARPAPPEPVRARSLTAALLERVDQQVPGTADRFSGQDDAAIAGPLDLADADREAYGRLVFTPDATGDPGFVGINLQARSPVPLREYRCGGSGAVSDVGAVTSCDRRVLDDGTVVLLVEGSGTQADGTTLVERVADSYHPGGLRVSVRSSNTDEESDGRKGDQEYAVHGEPALDFEQLTAVAGWPRWAMALPARYTRAGAALGRFEDLSQRPADLCGARQRLVKGRCV